MSAFVAGVQKGVAGTATALTSAGRKLTTRLTLPIAGAAAAAVALSVQFEDSMSKIEGLVGISAEQVDAWSQEILDLTQILPQSPKELAEALYFVTSAGIDTADAIDVLTASAKASAAGLGETQIVADAVTSAVNAYGIAALSASDATDVLTATVRLGKGEADEIAPSLGRVIPIAEALGIEFQEVGASVATMTLTGNSASVAVSALQAAMRTLLRPALSTKDTLADLGLTIDDVRESVAEKGLFQTLVDLRGEIGNNKDAMSALFPNTRALTFFLQLTGKAAEQNSNIFKELANSTGETNRAFEVASRTAGFKLQQSMSRLKAVAIEVGDVLVPIVVAIVDAFVDFLEVLLDLPGPIKVVGGALAGLALIIGPLLLLVGGLAKAFTGMAIGLVTVGAPIVKFINWLKLAAGMVTAVRLGTIGLRAAIAATIPLWAALAGAVLLAYEAYKAVDKFLKEGEGRIKTLNQRIAEGTNSWAEQQAELKLLKNEIGSFEGPFDILNGSLAVMDNYEEALRRQVEIWRNMAGAAKLGADGQQLFVDVMKQAAPLTQKQQQDLAGIIASYTRFVGPIDDATAAWITQMAAVGDVQGIIESLQGDIKGYTDGVHNSLGPQEQLTESFVDQSQHLVRTRNHMVRNGEQAHELAGNWAAAGGQIVGTTKKTGRAVVETVRLTQDQIKAMRDTVRNALGTSADVIAGYKDKAKASLGGLTEAFRRHARMTRNINDSWRALAREGVPQQFLADIVEGLGPKGAQRVLNELEGAQKQVVNRLVANWQRDKTEQDKLVSSIGNVKQKIDALPENKDININVRWNQTGDVPPNVGDRNVPDGTAPRPFDLPPAHDGGFIGRSGPIFAHAGEVIGPFDEVKDHFGAGGGGEITITDSNLGLVMEGTIEQGAAHKARMRRLRRRRR